MQTADQNAHLEKVKDLQVAFKSAVVFQYACKVISVAAQKGEVWPDDIDVNILAEGDRNCVGSVFRMLVNAGLLERCNTVNRRSNADGAKGRTIFKYTLVNRSLAHTFLNRNRSLDPLPPATFTQPDLFTV